VAIPVYLESGSKRVFACALDWPGWCRAGKGEASALEALAAYAPRFGVVAAEARVPFPPGGPDALEPDAFEVAERVAGSKSADFGSLGGPLARDAEPLSAEEAARQAALLSAAWSVFDREVAGAPADLRKGPRGGGRERDAIVRHVVEAEAGAYAPRIGLRLAAPPPGDAPAMRAHRHAILAVLGTAAPAHTGKGWPLRYAARRFTWHVLDHTWEIEDRREPAAG
jgi:hypothetical protein